MEFPIENLSVPISLDTVPVKRFFVLMSAFKSGDGDSVDVIITIKNGKWSKSKLQLSIPIDQTMLNKTNLRTVLFSSCVKARERLETAVHKLMRAVLESRRTFDHALIGTAGNCITYCGRGFSGLNIKV